MTFPTLNTRSRTTPPTLMAPAALTVNAPVACAGNQLKLEEPSVVAKAEDLIAASLAD